MNDLTILLEKTDQKPIVNPKSPVLLLGQNPPAWFAKEGAVHEPYPFNIDPTKDFDWHTKNRRGSPLYAAKIFFYITQILEQQPSFANLVTCVTKENKINADLLTDYVFKMDPPLHNVELIFCFGTMTHYLVNKLYGQFVHSPPVVKLKHPSYVTRFHRMNSEMHRAELDVINEAICDIILIGDDE